MKTKKIVTIAIMTALSIVLSIAESLIPTGIPGVKLGLANIVTVIILYLYSPKEALAVELIRILLTGLIYSGLFSQAFFLSLAGGILSFALMMLPYYLKKSTVATSVMGAIGHSIGQIVLASILLKSDAVYLYLPIILTLAIPSGVIIGYLSLLILKNFKIFTPKPKLGMIITVSILFLLSLSSLIVLDSYQKKNDEGTLAVVTYDNEEIMEISLSDPKKYTLLVNNGSFISMEEDDGSAYFTYLVYNKDEKETYHLVIEIKDEAIRIKEETSKKHICSKTGFIKNKYESLICLPNSFVVTLKDLKLAEIDAIM